MILHKGETLFRQGETGPLYRNEIIPHHSLITPKDYHGTAIALVTSEVEVIPSGEWYAELAQNPEKYREVALLLQDKLRMMQQRIGQLTVITPVEKLLELQQWFQTYISHVAITDVLTQEEIGQLLGMRRETVNRVLRSLNS